MTAQTGLSFFMGDENERTRFTARFEGGIAPPYPR